MRGDHEPISHLPYIGTECVERLENRGFHTTYDIQEASMSELLEVEGIGIGKVQVLKEFTQ